MILPLCSANAWVNKCDQLSLHNFHSGLGTARYVCPLHEAGKLVMANAKAGVQQRGIY